MSCFIHGVFYVLDFFIFTYTIKID